MKKMNVIGLALIGIILIGFSWYNTKQFEKQRRIQFQQDSIAAVQALQIAREQAEAGNTAGADSVPAAAADTQYVSTYRNARLEEAYRAESRTYRIENDRIVLEVDGRGAQPHRVTVKDYYTYDSLALELVKPGQSDFGIRFYSDQLITSSDFTFVPAERTDSTLALRLYFDETAYVEYRYALHPGSYLVDFDVNLAGMDRYIPRNATQFDLNWTLTVPRLERGYKNEKDYSTLAYKFPDEKSAENLGMRKDNASEAVKTRLEWFAFQQQFFSAILQADRSFTGGNLAYRFLPENDPHRNLMTCTAAMQFDAERGASVSIPFHFYFGPNLYKELKSYDAGFEKIVPLGRNIVSWINRFVIIPMFDFFSRFIGNFGIIILLMTLVIKLVLSPLTIKSYRSSAVMRVLKPEIDKINAKYPKQEDAMKKQQELMDLYRRSGVSMTGGCLPMLLQFPILIAMFRFFPASFELRQQRFLWAEDLSGYDSILDLPFSIPWYGDHVSLFALLMALSMFFYSRMNSDQMSSNPQMAGMKFMTLYFMPVFMLILCNNFSSGLSYYYMLSNLITIAQTWVIRKWFVDEEKILAKIREKSSAPRKKSKFQERLEAMQKAQQEALRQQQQQRRR